VLTYLLITPSLPVLPLPAGDNHKLVGSVAWLERQPDGIIHVLPNNHVVLHFFTMTKGVIQRERVELILMHLFEGMAG
jgi:hypothetical protein